MALTFPSASSAVGLGASSSSSSLDFFLLPDMLSFATEEGLFPFRNASTGGVPEYSEPREDDWGDSAGMAKCGCMGGCCGRTGGLG